ncbi:MAG: DUF779 domain-containing protein [Thermoplasmata archaeon]
MDVRFTPRTQGLIRRVQATHPDLYLLLDDTGCCGPSNVFLQDRPPAPVYEALGQVDGVDVYIHPTFAGGRAQAFTIDAYRSETDDSFSLETALGHRLTLGRRTEEARARDSPP